MTPEQIQTRVLTAVQKGIAIYGSKHQLLHATEELAELLTSLLRLLRLATGEAAPGELVDAAVNEAADVILSMGTVRAILGSDVDLAVLEKLTRYEARLASMEDRSSMNLEDAPPICGDPYPGRGEGMCLKDKGHDDLHRDQGDDGPRYW